MTNAELRAIAERNNMKVLRERISGRAFALLHESYEENPELEAFMKVHQKGIQTSRYDWFDGLKTYRIDFLWDIGYDN